MGAVFPKGNTTVTWTVDDGHGQTATCTTVITVEDNEDPLISCTEAITHDTNEGECQYTVDGNEFDASFTDNCSDGSITNDLNGMATLDGVILPKGDTTVIWTVDDGNGQIVTCTSVITIEDNEAPMISCVGAITQDTDEGECQYTVVGTEFDASFTDNCSDGSITNDLNGMATLDGVVLPKGDTTVIWTVDDGNGQVVTCTSVITIEDNEDPMISCVSDISVPNDEGDCSAIVEYTLPTISDNCPNLNLVQIAGIASGEAFPVGTTTNTFEVTDASGNTATCSFDVTVSDTEDPIAVCQNITVELNAMGVATITADDINDGSSDNCEIAEMSINISEFGCANIGDNDVILTVTDIHGNTSECTAVVTVNGIIPEVQIVQSELPGYCQGAFIILTALSDDATSYQWDTGEATPSIEVMADGIYTVTVTSETNCTATASYEVIGFDPESLLSAYIMIATKEVELKNDNQVLSGAIGVTNGNGKAKIKDNSHVAYFVKADDVDVDNSSSVGAAINAPAVIGLPTFIYNTASNNSSPDVTVNNNQSITLNGSVYGKVDVKDGGSVLFTSPDIYINELKTKKNASIEFAACANLYLNKRLSLDKDNVFNANGNYVVVYVDHHIDVKEGSYVSGHFYSSDKDIDVKGKDGSTTNMKGSFIANKIKGDKNVVWQSDPYCPTCIEVVEIRDGDPNVAQQSGMDYSSVLLYPNPAKGNVTIGNPENLELESANVYDLMGRLVKSFNLNGMETSKTLDVDNLAAATYIVIIKGKDGKTTKRLLKE